MWPLTLAYKEFRQLLPIQIVGFAIVLLTILGMCGINLLYFFNSNSHAEIPFYNITTFQLLPVVGTLLAGTTGYWQTLSESMRGTWLFLWHRPVSRMRITLVKLVSGIGLIWLVMVLPMLVYALWAGSKGSIAAPFLWENTLMYWKSCFGLSMIYLSCYLSGLRQARWYGTRLLPVLAVSGAFLLTTTTEYYAGLSLLLIFAVDAILIAAIFTQCHLEDFS
ncbi:hypothetical protein [Rubinisphaera italica]|uniref:ABC-2 family transporter protein n=1 Tax=Rubinisphaera italica TaxID=2527969 RepID=A0A5C5XHB8_9PLAN|nr:hypothetical protein [Rubinisphaera italica]TWT62078.1 hypothetical protein Pan54_28170 [Rubinisphaera italica]